MSRDSQAGLIALNRFGLGARGSASGDFVNAASDPRGFVKFELSRPNGGLLEVPGLQSTPDLATAVFAYQAEVRKAREAAKSAAVAPSESSPPQPVPQPADNTQRRNLSLNAMDMAAQAPAMQTPEIKAQDGGASATMAATEPMQPTAAMMVPNAPKPPPQQLNIIQKAFRAEALARLQRAVLADCGFSERLVAFWSTHF
jgi:uncharacterized protein (DUF1800 family)